MTHSSCGVLYGIAEASPRACLYVLAAFVRVYGDYQGPALSATNSNCAESLLPCRGWWRDTAQAHMNEDEQYQRQWFCVFLSISHAQPVSPRALYMHAADVRAGAAQKVLPAVAGCQSNLSPQHP